MQLNEIIQSIETMAPLPLQEDYDNSGLLTGHPDDTITGALITLDVTESVIEEAIKLGYNLIIAHHPLIFKPLKKINGNNEVERCVIKAIRNKIAIYTAHTNLDNSMEGVNAMLCRKIGLTETSILSPINGNLRKLVVFVPVSHAEKVRQAMFVSGAGHIGQYDSCSFNTAGSGTFRALEGANPFVGQQGEIHSEPEIRIESIVPKWLESRVLSAVREVHPYEEIAWDSYVLTNSALNTGAGMTGKFENPLQEEEFILRLKEVLKVPLIKCSPLTGKKISKVAVCGGSGNFLIQEAIRSGAHAFVTGELKYHDYFLAEGRILLVEAGHYETEQFTKELLYQVVKEKFPTFALQISTISTNPVNYL
ncbi:MAG: Nif3-like dinuclear metal center hexameric protein [Bacteroidales bacterium]|nr:Nif3-like dinuclear metal center hexameric protein [Bacteroidales bacterium]